MDHFLSIHQTIPYNFTFAYQKEEWFKNIKKRIDYENDTKDEIEFKDSGIPWWPKKTETCYDEFLKSEVIRDQTC